MRSYRRSVRRPATRGQRGVGSGSETMGGGYPVRLHCGRVMVRRVFAARSKAAFSMPPISSYANLERSTTGRPGQPARGSALDGSCTSSTSPTTFPSKLRSRVDLHRRSRRRPPRQHHRPVIRHGSAPGLRAARSRVVRVKPSNWLRRLQARRVTASTPLGRSGSWNSPDIVDAEAFLGTQRAREP